MQHQPHGDPVEQDLLDGVAELIGRVVALGEDIAQRLELPGHFLKAMLMLERPMPMKDLGKRMHCDPSFVTVVADMLEKRGLGCREPHPGDRRVKNIVLNSDGLALKCRIESELAARMPWSSALTPDERIQLLALIRKMLRADAQSASPAAAGAATEQAVSPPEEPARSPRVAAPAG